MIIGVIAMCPTKIDDIKQYFKDHNIKLSMTRIKIYQYIALHKTHPTADEIYSELSKELITMAKATVYNTLHMFVDKEIARVVRVEDAELRYDVEMEYHSHFKCIDCGEIYNVDFDLSQPNIKGLEGFKVMEYHSHIRGLCPTCNKKH